MTIKGNKREKSKADPPLTLRVKNVRIYEEICFKYRRIWEEKV